MKIYGIEDEATAIQLAQLMKLNSECVKLQWSRTIKNIPQTVKNALEKTPPELGADIAEHGLMLTGGGALLRDIDLLLKEEQGFPCMLQKNL